MDEAKGARVVVGIGESLAALHALRYGVAEARRRGRSLRAVRVWQVDVPWHGVGVDTVRVDAGTEAISTIQRSFDQAMGGLPHNLDFELIAVEGPVGPALVAQASDDDLLILGAPERRWWTASRFNLVRHCVRFAPCPVVVVPAEALAREYGAKATARAAERVEHEAERYAATGGEVASS